METATIKQITEVDVDFDTTLDDLLESEEKEISLIPPDSKINARPWILAYRKAKNDNAFFKDEYLPMLQEKYIIPVKEKMEKNETKMDFIASQLLIFLENIGEKSTSLPDIGTITRIDGDKNAIAYPEDKSALEALAEELYSNESTRDLVKVEKSIKKTEIKKWYEARNSLPSPSLAISPKEDSLRFTEAKKKSKKE